MKSLKKQHFIVVLSTFISLYNFAQTDTIKVKEKPKVIYYKDQYIYEGDTMVVELKEVNILKKLTFASNDDQAYFMWLRRKVHKAYPYAILAQERMLVIDENLKNIKNRSQRKVYLKRMEEYFENELTDQLKNLTVTEGRILIKLIHRQTGKTVYDLSKQYKNGWSTFWSQRTAKLFKQDLKDKYEPATDNEDFLTELILERSFEDASLTPPKPTVLKFDFETIKKNNGKIIPVEWRIKKK